MPWERMRFRDQIVWVNTDGGGAMVLDGQGRAEMKYRENDEKVYRPSGRNLTALRAGEAVPAEAPARPRASRSAPGQPAARLRQPFDAAAETTVLRQPLAGAVQIWTDGACTGNPGPMGIGMVVITSSKRIERGEYLGVGTNNIAELTAIARGIDLAMGLGIDPQTPLSVHTDSGYSIGVLAQGWKAKANTELIAELRERLKAHPNLRFVKVEGHAGIADNERCDELARMAIKTRARV